MACGLATKLAAALILVACLMCSTAAQAEQDLRGSWSARSSTGLTLGGTWTARADPKTGPVTGTWTLADARGRVTRRGAWSAAKAATGWTGGWSAVVDGRPGAYTGTWRANIELPASAAFAELFATAVAKVVTGTWGVGRQSGTWSIRAFN